MGGSRFVVYALFHFALFLSSFKHLKAVVTRRRGDTKARVCVCDRNPRTWVFFLSFPRSNINREIDQKWSGQDPNRNPQRMLVSQAVALPVLHYQTHDLFLKPFNLCSIFMQPLENECAGISTWQIVDQKLNQE